MSSRYFPAIDLAKGLAIISVILLHATPADLLGQTLYQFHVSQAVPVFMVLAGLTLMITFGRPGRGDRLRDRAGLSYLGRRARRIVLPLVPVFAVSLLFGIWSHSYYAGVLWIAGCLPVAGPGNYFVTIMLELIIVAPFLSYFYRRSPRLLLAGMVLADLGFQLIAPHVGLFADNSYAYSACILRYFSAIALGMLLSDEYLRRGRVDLKGGKYRVLLLAFPVSVAYLAAGVFLKQPLLPFNPSWGTQNVLSFAYTAVLVVFLLNLDAGRLAAGIAGRWLLLIGRASYHIFLVQILFFGFGLSFMRMAVYGPLPVAAAVLLDVAATVVAGVLYYLAEQAMRAFFGSVAKRTIKPPGDHVRASN